MACISGFTIGGYYNYVDCCGLIQTGLSSGLVDVCVDTTYSGSAIGVILDSGSTCTINCNQGPLSYNFELTGICSAATGSVIINGFGGTPPYTIDPVTPIGSGLPTKTGFGPFTYTGLTGGTYVFRINDSLGLQNNELYINVTVSNCFYANIFNTSGTTCGLTNGTLSVSATSNSGPYNIILYKDGNFNQLQTTNNLPYTFYNLDSGIYYATIYDYGSTTANTENVVINNSTSVDFGFWKVDTSNCVIDKGKLAITGVTGVAPFTYLWSNGETGQLITGLTAGVYSCTVTDSLGCSTTKSEIINAAQPLGVGLTTSVTPSCFSSDGSITYSITGGTRPLYFSASTGQVGYTLGDTVTITNLSSGSYPIIIRDANFCEINLNGFLSQQNGFNVVNTIITNSNCNQDNANLYVEIQGFGGFYTYTLSGQTSGVIYSNISQDQFYTFNNLPNDNYVLSISGSGTNCFYSSNLTIDSEQKFTLSTTTTGATCGSATGGVTIFVGSGYSSPLTYNLSNGFSEVSPFSSATFNFLSPGPYTLTVTDSTGCISSESFTIATTGSLLSSVNKTNCTDGNDGSAQVIIYEGEPIFTYQWSNNVCCSQTGSTVTGLTAGTYSVIVTDSNGCFNIHNFQIICTGTLISGYEVINICKNEFETTSGNKRGFFEMLNEGFVDLTSGLTNCYLSSATFNCEIEINGSAFTETFYTATTLNDYPQDIIWQNTLEEILSGITDVGSYTVDILNNKIQIKSNCVGDFDPLGGLVISIGVSILYDIYCLIPSP